MKSEWADDALADGEYAASQGRGLGALANALGPLCWSSHELRFHENNVLLIHPTAPRIRNLWD